MRLDTLAFDFRCARRSLLAAGNRGYTLAAVATLALSIGAVSAIASIGWQLLYAPLPYAGSERVVRVHERNPSRGLPEFSVSGPNFLSWQERTRSFEQLAALDSESANLSADGAVARVEAISTTPALWRVLGLPPVAGRSFSAAESTHPAAPVAMLGERLARDRYGSAAAAVGKIIRVNGVARTVVGVAAQDVGFSTDTSLWLPLSLDPEIFTRGDRRLAVLARLADGATIESAAAELATLSAALGKEFPAENQGWEAAVEPVRDWIVGSVARSRMTTLLAAVLVLMLVAASNVASLEIARATRRAREVGVRQALGAARTRLIALLAIENAVLFVLASAIGVALAAAAIAFAVATLPAATPRLAAFALDPRIAALAIGANAAFAFGFGLVPTLLATRTRLAESLKSGGRSTADRARTTLRQALVVVQFGFATVLVVGAVLLAQELARLRDQTLGFEPGKLLIARITMPSDSEQDYRAASARYRALADRIAALPGVAAVGYASEMPFGSFDTSFAIAAGAGKLDYDSEGGINAAWRVVSADYFAALGVPLLRGRRFAADGESGRSMLLSEGLAKRVFGDGVDPIGQTVRLGNGRNGTVVGVVGDVRQRGLGEEPTPTMYMPTAWILTPTMTLAIRTEQAPAGLIAPVREVASRVAPDHPLFDLGTMGAVIDASVAQPKLQTAVLVAFAGASLALAAIGIAGLLAFLVAARTQELALRLALGASGERVVAIVLGRGGMLCAIGLGSGLVLVAALAPAYGAAFDGVDLWLAAGASLAVLALVALLACWLPARRVGELSPALALRGD